MHKPCLDLIFKPESIGGTSLGVRDFRLPTASVGDDWYSGKITFLSLRSCKNESIIPDLSFLALTRLQAIVFMKHKYFSDLFW